MQRYKTLFVTQRGQRHQEAALQAAPEELDITMRRTSDKSEIMTLVSDADFLVSERSGVVDADIIDAGKKLKLIQRLGSQVWDIDVKHARQKKIPVCSMPVKSCIFVAEHVLLQIHCLKRRIRELFEITDEAEDWGTPKRCNEDYFAFNWSKRTVVGSIFESTVGIIGFGEIGTELARRLRGYGCDALYSKRTQLPRDVEKDLRIRWVDRNRLAEASDVVVCLLPNLPQNNQFIDADFFSKMKRGALFVHCGAPGVVNEDDLIAALRSCHLGGAAIDCFTYEPLRPNDPLLDLSRNTSSNLLLTPHIAAGLVAANKDERVSDFANLMAFIRGERLSYEV